MSTQPDALIVQETVIIESPRPMCRECKVERSAIAALGDGKGLCWVCNGLRLRAAKEVEPGYLERDE